MSSNFLYEKWLATSHAFAGEIALFDLASDKSWTFAQLRRESEQVKKTSAPLAFPCGSDPGFILSVLNAWRDRSVTCPLEAGQSAQHIPKPAADIAHLKLTSATSGVSKCIAFTGPQLAADADNIMQTMGLTVESPNLSCISLAHSYGFSNLVLPLLLHGVPLVLVPAPLPELLMRAAKPFRSISLPAVPALWKTWHVSKSIPPNTRIAISAGAPLPLDLEQAVFEESNLKIHNFYGSSECGGIAYDRTDFPRTAANCVGSALKNVTLSISSAGNLVIESAAVGLSYLPEPQPNLHAERFETTDLAELRNNQVFLHGRASDLLNIAGRKASPESIESALRTHPAVLECVVFGIQDSKDRADTVVAVVKCEKAVPISDLTQFLSERLPAWQIPRRWWFSEELLPNNRGKISRNEWRRRYMERR